MSADRPLRLHATAIAIDGHAVLLLGPSGSGKSDLALRLIDAGALLIADDQVELVAIENVLCCRAPSGLAAELRGLIEARGVGILPVPSAEGPVPVAWAVELSGNGQIERLPAAETREWLGHEVPLLRLDPFQASTPAKLRLALRAGPGLIMGRA